MKSIVQESSSISKAIEKAWNRAGRPKEFSIKIFEEAKKNFIGLTIKSAKIGLFFKEQFTERPFQKYSHARKQTKKTIKDQKQKGNYKKNHYKKNNK